MVPLPIVIELRGHVPGKKNAWRRRPNGGVGITDDAIKAAIARLELQIPGHVRDLHLEHPGIDIHFTYARGDWDTDNSFSTLLDILVKYGVLANDNIAHCNGRKTIWPAVKGDYDEVRIILTPQGEESHGTGSDRESTGVAGGIHGAPGDAGSRPPRGPDY